jgi:metaxin
MSETKRFIYKAYLNFSGVAYQVVPSSNHASPSGMLPFLQPAATARDMSNAPDAVTSNKLRKWAQAQSPASVEESEDLRYEAYASLVSNALRKAWVSWDD